MWSESKLLTQILASFVTYANFVKSLIEVKFFTDQIRSDCLVGCDHALDHLYTGIYASRLISRVAEVAREHGWHPPKSLDSDEKFKPEHTLFCRELRFFAIYALFFGDLLAYKVTFWVKTVLLGKKCTITWYILHILLSLI